jgi:hypothetical protein
MYRGLDYRSKATLFGLPLVHVASGLDPATGKQRVAKGIIAIGGMAKGVVAFGGMAMGGLTFGGLSLGVISFGGCSLGLVAFGGLAVALLVALGGGAIAPIAMGGGAIGYLAYGGGAIGAHVLDAATKDPLAERFFLPWAKVLFEHSQMINAVLVLTIIGIGVGVPLWLQRRTVNKPSASGQPASKNSTKKKSGWPLLVLVLSPLVAFAMILAWLSLSYKNAESHANHLTSVASPQSSIIFGPMIERVIPDPAEGTACVLNFETGNLLQPPAEVLRALSNDIPTFGPKVLRWLRDNGGDAVVAADGSIKLLEGVVATPMKGHAATWEELTPSLVVAGVDGMNEEERNASIYQPAFHFVTLRFPAALVFTPRDRSMGVIQILSSSANPRGVKLRYKLVQTSPGLKTSASLDAANASNGDSRRSGSTGLLRPDTTIRATGGKVIVDNANGRLTADQVTLGPSNTLTATGSNIMYEVRGKPAPK